MGFKDLSYTKKGAIIGLAIGLIGILILLIGGIAQSIVSSAPESPGISPCDARPIACAIWGGSGVIGGIINIGGLLFMLILSPICFAIYGDMTCAFASFRLSLYFAPITYLFLGALIGWIVGKIKSKKQ